MLPDIGMMIGVYILLRCCELICSSESRYSSKFALVVVRILAVVCFLVTLFFIADLALSGSQQPSLPKFP